MGAAGLWSGILRSPLGRSNEAEETGREGWTNGLSGLSRDGSLARIAVRRSRQRMLPGIEAPAQSVADLFRHSLAAKGGIEGCLSGRLVRPGRASTAFLSTYKSLRYRDNQMSV